jgi:DDE superfamily endonuclease
VFLDESGFLLIPNVRKTWAPVGCTPRVRHSYTRDKLSAISALSVSPRCVRLGLYMHIHAVNITGAEVVVFLRHLLRHLRGPVNLLWDGSPIHRRDDVKGFLKRHPRLQVHRFPAYAPELNPDEFVWTKLKNDLAKAPLNTFVIWIANCGTPFVESTVLNNSCGPASSPPTCPGYDAACIHYLVKAQ